MLVSVGNLYGNNRCRSEYVADTKLCGNVLKSDGSNIYNGNCNLVGLGMCSTGAIFKCVGKSEGVSTGNFGVDVMSNGRSNVCGSSITERSNCKYTVGNNCLTGIVLNCGRTRLVLDAVKNGDFDNLDFNLAALCAVGNYKLLLTCMCEVKIFKVGGEALGNKNSSVGSIVVECIDLKTCNSVGLASYGVGGKDRVLNNLNFDKN